MADLSRQSLKIHHGHTKSLQTAALVLHHMGQWDTKLRVVLDINNSLLVRSELSTVLYYKTSMSCCLQAG